MSIKSWFSKLTERGGAKYAIAEQFLFGEGKQGGILDSKGEHINNLGYKLTNSTEAQKEVLDKFGIVPKKYTEIYNDISEKRLKHSTVIDILTDKNGYVTQQVEKIKGPKSLNVFLDNKLIHEILYNEELFPKYKSALKMESWAKYIIRLTPNDAKSLGLASKPLCDLLYKQKQHVLANYLAICEGSLHDKQPKKFGKIMSKAKDFTKSALAFFEKNNKSDMMNAMSDNGSIVDIFINLIHKDSSLFLPLLRLKAFGSLMEQILGSLKKYFISSSYATIEQQLSPYSLKNTESYYANAKNLYKSIEDLEEINESGFKEADKKDSVKAAEAAAQKLQSLLKRYKIQKDVEKKLREIRESKSKEKVKESVEYVKEEIKNDENINEKDKKKIEENINQISENIDK